MSVFCKVRKLLLCRAAMPPPDPRKPGNLGGESKPCPLVPPVPEKLRVIVDAVTMVRSARSSIAIPPPLPGGPAEPTTVPPLPPLPHLLLLIVQVVTVTV